MLDVLTVPLQAEGTHNGSTSCADAQGNVPVKKVAMRLAALDIVRGFTVAVMIFVDDAGDSLQHINHAPWHGLNLADIVMPWFLFMVGNAMAFSLKITTGSGRCAQLQKLIFSPSRCRTRRGPPGIRTLRRRPRMRSCALRPRHESSRTRGTSSGDDRTTNDASTGGFR